MKVDDTEQYLEALSNSLILWSNLWGDRHNMRTFLSALAACSGECAVMTPLVAAFTSRNRPKPATIMPCRAQWKNVGAALRGAECGVYDRGPSWQRGLHEGRIPPSSLSLEHVGLQDRAFFEKANATCHSYGMCIVCRPVLPSASKTGSIQAGCFPPHQRLLDDLPRRPRRPYLIHISNIV